MSLGLDKYHGTRTLCDSEWAYFDHDDKLVRASRSNSDHVQQYIGNGAWKDKADGWSSRANFLMPGGETTPLHDPAEMDEMVGAINSRVAG
ncbi:hypothetical protein [Nevskia sp.]|uniref:hypothetical protein n=1 Tax=Nevskia sp. TaxID=1929292 RepID=UPI0025D4B58B|nr:hypothetical protein [Nevskia sp.]